MPRFTSYSTPSDEEIRLGRLATVLRSWRIASTKHSHGNSSISEYAHTLDRVATRLDRALVDLTSCIDRLSAERNAIHNQDVVEDEYQQLADQMAAWDAEDEGGAIII